MIEETAHHNGRADLIRENIDGATGEWMPVSGEAGSDQPGPDCPTSS